MEVPVPRVCYSGSAPGCCEDVAKQDLRSQGTRKFGDKPRRQRRQLIGRFSCDENATTPAALPQKHSQCGSCAASVCPPIVRPAIEQSVLMCGALPPSLVLRN
eukprot:6213200-Pleurochrysis_carterae.AAC.6